MNNLFSQKRWRDLNFFPSQVVATSVTIAADGLVHISKRHHAHLVLCTFMCFPFWEPFAEKGTVM